MLREDELPHVVSVYMGFACLFFFCFPFSLVGLSACLSQEIKISETN